MCLAIPLKITEVNTISKEAMAEIEGVIRKIRTDFISELKVGDYVLVHAGFAIEKLNEEDALANMELIKEVTDAALGRV
jgi:hydrogenase expression/formation protein HypC